MGEHSALFDRPGARRVGESTLISGNIQPFGCLVAAAGGDGTIVYASANTEHFLDRSPAKLLGSNGADLLGRDTWPRATETAEGGAFDTTYTVESSDQKIYVSVHRSEPWVLFEIEPFEEMGGARLSELQSMQEDLLARASLQSTLEAGVDHVARLTGYEHVMLYRFHPNWDGEVVAEVVSDRMSRYQGHRFPASDIPEQVRELYRKNILRIIPDTDHEAVPVLGAIDEPLDLSGTWLRGVPPIYLEFLENMGVRASLVISIIVNEQLWGLVVCHHSSPRFLSHGIRRLARFYGQHFSTQVELQSTAQQQAYIDRYHETIQLSPSELREGDRLADYLRSRGDRLLKLMNADGMVVSLEGETETFGSVPPPSELSGLLDWIEETEIDEIWHTAHLSAHYPGGSAIVDTASGILVVGLPHDDGNMVVWFRPEVVCTIRWGGNPYMPAGDDDTADSLSPRNSFDTWKEQVENQSEPWRVEHVEAARILRRHLLEAVIVEKSVQQSEQLDIINRILSHDIQNSVGVIVAYADMLGTLDDPTKNRYLRRILRAGRDTIGMTRSASTLATAIRKGNELERSPVDVEAMVLRLVESMNATYEDVVVSLKPRETSDAIEVEAGPLLESVIRNLIHNGVKHNDKQKKLVQVALEDRDTAVRIHVADNGPGIPEAQRNRLFAEGQTRLESANTGIGLYLVRLITHQYGGRVWIEDNEPAGTVFVVELQKAKRR